MYPPGSEVVGKEAAQDIFKWIARWFTRNRDLKNEAETLKAEVAEERSGRLAFANQLSELECRPDDDHMYWRKDGHGGPYCPLCIHENSKVIPMINGISEGSFYCSLHKQYFETRDKRLRTRNRALRPSRPYRGGPWS